MREISGQQLFDKLGYDHLRNGALFGALSQETIAFLLDHGQVFQVAPGEVLYKPGDSGDNFFVVCSGSVDFFKYHEGEFARTRTVSFGDQVGFVAMIALHDHVGKAVVAEAGAVLKVDSSLFAEFHDLYPFEFGVLLMNLTRDIARALRKVSNTLVEENRSHW